MRIQGQLWIHTLQADTRLPDYVAPLLQGNLHQIHQEGGGRHPAGVLTPDASLAKGL